MTPYLAEQLKRRRRNLLAIIPMADLKTIYNRVVGDKQFYSVWDYRFMMLRDWEKYEAEIKNWVSVCWEGW